jgi:hypothetical protein
VQKAAQFRAIFRELRQSLPEEVPAHELMRLANHILRSYSGEFDKADPNERSRELRNLRYKPVDEAIDDGGWWLYSIGEADGERLNFETTDSPDMQARLERFLGLEWQNRIPPG